MCFQQQFYEFIILNNLIKLPFASANGGNRTKIKTALAAFCGINSLESECYFLYCPLEPRRGSSPFFTLTQVLDNAIPLGQPPTAFAKPSHWESRSINPRIYPWGFTDRHIILLTGLPVFKHH